jgi:hypothetical protein
MALVAHDFGQGRLTLSACARRHRVEISATESVELFVAIMPIMGEVRKNPLAANGDRPRQREYGQRAKEGGMAGKMGWLLALALAFLARPDAWAQMPQTGIAEPSSSHHGAANVSIAGVSATRACRGSSV